MFLPTITAGGHSTHFIDQNNNCWACGSNEKSQLGVQGKSHSKPLLLDQFNTILKPAVQLVSSGMNHTLFLDLEGNAWSCGAHDKGQREYQRKGSCHIAEPQFRGLGIISMVSCGDNFSSALTEEGQVYVMGQIDPNNNQRYPLTCLTTTTPVKYISCGKSHMVFLDFDQQVWTVGSNISGQLGNTKVRELTNPQKLENLPPIISVACGGFHSLLLDKDGAVHSCGKNRDGQLGIGDGADRWTFEKVNSEISFQQIAAGGFHSLFLDMQGNAYSCGYDNDGQTGIMNEKITVPPLPSKEALKKKLRKVSQVEEAYQIEMQKYQQACLALVSLAELHYSPRQIPMEQPIQFISAGYLHSLFLDTSGHLWCCGYNNFGQLGTGDCIKREVPTKIKGDFEILTILREPSVVKNARKN